MKAPWEFDRPLCAEVGTQPFFPDVDDTRERDTATLTMQAAKRLCKRCDHVQECLTWALTTGEDHGIWGGTSPAERKSLKRQRTRLQKR